MSLKTTTKTVCDIKDLELEVIKLTGKEADEVTLAFQRTGILPNAYDSFLSLKNGKVLDNTEYEWLNYALVSIFKEKDIEELTIEA